MTYDLKITALLWKRASIRCCSVMRALEKQLQVFTEMIQLRSFLVFWRSSSQKYTCQLFLSQMREISPCRDGDFRKRPRYFQIFPTNFRTLPNVPKIKCPQMFPKTFEPPVAGWGRIFTTGLTIMTYNRVAFSTELLLDFLKVLRFSFSVLVT